jgi:hypothetical protein
MLNVKAFQNPLFEDAANNPTSSNVLTSHIFIPYKYPEPSKKAVKPE